MALSHGTRGAIRRHWAGLLGCGPAAFEQSGVTLTGQTGRTIRLLRRRNATVVAAPERVSGRLATCRPELAERSLTAADDVIQRALSEHSADVVDVHGPAVLAYADAAAFSPVTADAQLLDAGDEQAFDGLHRQVPDEEWQRASPTFRPGRTAGAFRNGALVGIATLTDPPFPDVGVVVTPGHRGAGVGRQVVSRLITAVVERDGGVVLRYRTPASESASLALAASLGFERWASESVVILD